MAEFFVMNSNYDFVVGFVCRFFGKRTHRSISLQFIMIFFCNLVSFCFNWQIPVKLKRPSHNSKSSFTDYNKNIESFNNRIVKSVGF